ncbi:glycine-rich domain-containing protein 1 isoform X1 [Hevea brasiliensis]|uniref:glycine-rich domain-containing protein 1 isoform X1 n=1 Tax=Hevea brasiliensis TaxID=3981 RepID=UPI0025E819FE|nr:glycine-rich domain-containing protein 1 isoform X1 [Hevea brasiliensis]
MSVTRNGADIATNISARTLSEISAIDTVRLSFDLVSAARRNIGFLRAVSESQWLHDTATVVEAIRRYDELWMPMISDLMVGSTPPMVLPPFDIEWVWFCHTLNPVSYRQYCEARFSKLIGKPAIFDQENEDYALMRCKELWMRRYPTECFENEIDSGLQSDSVVKNEDLFNAVKKQRFLYSKFSWPYMSELVYLIAARQRYKGFLYVLQRFTDGCFRIVPTLDILLMWMTHQSYPTVYAEDMKEMEVEILGKIVGMWETVQEKEVQETKEVWEKAFDQPYEKAGGTIDFHGLAPVQPPVYWEVSDTDVNTKYKSLLPRFLLQATVKAVPDDKKHNFLRLRMLRCHRELKIDKPISSFSLDSWKKASQLYCEFGTRGLILELQKHGGGCFNTNKSEDTATFLWNDLLRAHSHTVERELNKQMRVVASITPPVQAPYLLKCVPDRVTDDSGAMISDVILRMNHYKPQDGRWLSRTVLDHAGRECFVVRIRVGGGFWRRGGETPSAVKWEDRIIEVREGSWSYVAGSIGRAPEKVVATATPKEPPKNCQASWCFSTGEEFLVSWQSPSTSLCDLRFCLLNQTTPDSTMKLFKGRKLQYQVRKTRSEDKEISNDEEEGFVTLVRFTEDNPTRRATALLNWKLLIVEILPEEDAVLAILICISILRSVSEMRKEDVGSLLIRRRIKEAKLGTRDWGSVILHPSSCSSSISSPYLQPWYWNPKAVITSDRGPNVTRQPTTNYSPVEGGDKLYKPGIIT